MHKTGKMYKAIKNIDNQNKTTYTGCTCTYFALLNGVKEQTAVHKIQDTAFFFQLQNG